MVSQLPVKIQVLIRTLKTFLYFAIFGLYILLTFAFGIISCTEEKRIFIDHDSQTRNSRAYELFIVINNIRCMTKIDKQY